MLGLHHVFMANYGHNSTTSLESNAEELRRLNDDLTGKLAGFEAMSDCVSAVATEIGLACGRERSRCMLMSSQPTTGTTRLLEPTDDLLARLSDGLTGKLDGFEAMLDHLSSAATEIGLAYGGEDSECMMSVRDLHHVSRERSINPVSGDRAEERCFMSIGRWAVYERRDGKIMGSAYAGSLFLVAILCVGGVERGLCSIIKVFLFRCDRFEARLVSPRSFCLHGGGGKWPQRLELDLKTRSLLHRCLVRCEL